MDIEMRSSKHFKDHSKRMKEFNEISAYTVKSSRSSSHMTRDIYDSQKDFDSWLSTTSIYEHTYR